MKLKPIFTEKSMKLAREGKYSFWVLPGFTKTQIRKAVEDLFSVEVTDIKTLNYKKLVKKTWKGHKAAVSARKKAVITLKSGKIDLFEENKK